MSKYVYEKLEEAEKDALRFYQRGEYYYEQGNYPEALVNYIDSLSSYVEYIEYTESAWRVRELEQFNAGEIPYVHKEISYGIESKINFNFDLAIRLIRITTCCNNPLIKAYIAEKLTIIFESLSNYQKEFDVQDIENFNELGKWVQLQSKVVAENKEALEGIKKIKPEQEQDETLKKIRKALLRISKTKISLKPLEEGADSSCFIATAAYATSTHPDLDTFRSFRDETLLTNPVGKQLVNFYYQISPTIAQYVEKQPAIKSFVRHKLERLAQSMRNQQVKNQ